MTTVTLARNAMATRFELVLHGGNAVSLRAAGEEVLNEIERIEAQLSLFRPSSEIAHLNARAAHEPVRVTPAVFALLTQAKRLTQETGGAFDITVAPLMRCWGFLKGAGRSPSEAELREVRQRVGMHLVQLNESNLTVQFQRDGVMLDLGAIGKGYAIERGVELLREAEVESALLHGGTSTVFALGSPPDAEFWHVGVPIAAGAPATTTGVPSPHGSRDTSKLLLRTHDFGEVPTDEMVKIPLKDEGLSVSAVWGRFFDYDGKRLGHVMDPRTGRPVNRASIAVVATSSPTETDALSTALLTLGFEGHSQISGLRPGMRTLVGAGSGAGLRTVSHGIALNRPGFDGLR